MLETIKLKKIYENGVLAVNEVDLKIEAGEIFVLLGANGAGKTTIIMLILGFTDPTSGTALINGIDVVRNPLKAKKHIAYVSENVIQFGYTPEELLTGKTLLSSIVYPEDLHRVAQEVSGYSQSGVNEFNQEYRIVTKSGDVRYVDDRSWIRRDNEGKITHYQGIMLDITKRKLSEEAVHKSEEKFYKTFHNSPDAITITRTSDGSFIDVNESFYRISGYVEEEVIGRSSVDLNFWVSPEDRARYISILKKEKQVLDFETAFRKKNGELRDFLLAGEVIELNGEPCIIGILRDITERKREEEEIKRSRVELHLLSTHLQDVREEERKSLAREMHDEIGQILTSIKMNLSFLRRQVEAGEKKIKIKELDKEIQSMSEMVDHAVVRVRKIITELRPELLDKLGLIPALEWFIEEFAKETKIKCEYKFKVQNLGINQHKKLAVFRIVQETLTNVARHANATKVKVSIKKTNHEIIVEIKDNGVGISDEKRKGENSFGLLGMRERATITGGTLEISGAEGKGTTVKLIIGQ